MLKEELDKLTKHESTLEEYEAVEAWYMKDGKASKEDAAKLWKTMYLDAAKAREEAARVAGRLDALRAVLDKGGFPLVLKLYTRAGTMPGQCPNLKIKAGGFNYEIHIDWFKLFQFTITNDGPDDHTLYAVATWDENGAGWTVDKVEKYGEGDPA